MISFVGVTASFDQELRLKPKNGGTDEEQHPNAPHDTGHGQCPIITRGGDDTVWCCTGTHC